MHRMSVRTQRRRPVTDILSDESIPFRLLGQAHLIVVDAFLNDAGPFALILDTGASMTVVSPAVVRRLGVVGRGMGAQAVGVTGSLAARIIPVRRLIVDQRLDRDRRPAVR